MLRYLRTALLLLTLALTLLLIVWNTGIHRTPLPGSAGEMQQVEALLRTWKAPMHHDLPWRMQQHFPEGAGFAYALYGLANCQAARWSGPDRASAHLAEAAWSLEHLESDTLASYFPLLPPERGVFLAGWQAYLQGSLLAAAGAAPSAEELLAHMRRCDELAEAFRGSDSPFLASYPDGAWPADNTVAVAALALYDAHWPSRYADVIERWVEDVRRTMPADGRMAHAWDPAGDTARITMRGSSLALMCIFLPAIAPDLAEAQFAAFQRAFFAERFGVPVITEHPWNAWGEGDVDSGPLILGVGPVATIVGAGACRVNGDALHDLEMSSTVDAFGLVMGGKERRYLFGAMPMADLFIAWCRSMPVPEGAAPVRPRYLRFHLWSLLFAAMLWSPWLWRSLRRNRG